MKRTTRKIRGGSGKGSNKKGKNNVAKSAKKPSGKNAFAAAMAAKAAKAANAAAKEANAAANAARKAASQAEIIRLGIKPEKSRGAIGGPGKAALNEMRARATEGNYVKGKGE